MAIVRTARRLRQEAAGAGTELTPTAASALATVERHGPLTPSELAEIERIKRPTATRTLRVLEEAGLVDRAPDPADGRSCPGQRQRRRPRAPAPPARPQERLPGAPHARPSRSTTSRPWSAPPRSSRGCLEERVGERRRPPQLRLPLRPQLPPLLRRAAGLALGDLDADGGGDLAGPHASPASGVAVGLTTALQFLPMLLFGAWGGLLADRIPEAAAADRHPGADGDPGDRPARRHRDRRRRPLDGLRRGLRDGAGQRGRQPDPAELRDRDGRRPTGSSTRSASTASSSRRRGSSARRSPGC